MNAVLEVLLLPTQTICYQEEDYGIVGTCSRNTSAPLVVVQEAARDD
jgi:hypothetical protein